MNVEIVINGKKRYVRDRTTVFEACREAGVYIPHFCYHPKLSIVANCRMCLVQVEKTPKPVPACATYVTDGMVIHTDSPAAQAAQKGVMEFLLINHPLDCPICDQGGECQLQDLAVGYGSSCTRYGENKRVVVEKNLGPLITTVMTRCIHCTRCVRFGQEVAGQMELGMSGRGEHSEIMPFVESTVDSELSGNMIDICPVGALNSKPFRFSARTWELRRSDGVAQHDSWGSMIILQSKDEVVKRVLPLDHEEINECWISDRDRFAYTGINVPDRFVYPHVLDPGAAKSRRVEWAEALESAAEKLQKVVKEHGPGQVGMLLGPGCVSEEAMLAEQLIRTLGSGNIDHRLRQQDFSMDVSERGVPWMGCSIEQLRENDNILIVGSDPSRELPLLPVSLRKAISNRAKVSVIGASSLERQLECAHQIVSRPSAWVEELAMVCKAAAGDAKMPEWASKLGEPQERHKEMAATLGQGKNPAILLGAQAQHVVNYGALRQLAILLAKHVGGFHGMLVEGANMVGMALAGAVPHHGFMCRQEQYTGMNALEMINQGLKAYILVGCEPLDFADPARAEEAFKGASTICVGSYMDTAKHYADFMLPAALFAERKGAMVNLEGNAATMEAAVLPAGESRPAWKIFRVLGNMLGLEGFDYDDINQVRAKLIEAGDYAEMLRNELHGEPDAPQAVGTGVKQGEFERVPETAHYATDQIVRRAEPLQETRIARDSHVARFHPDDLASLGAESGMVTLTAGEASVTCACAADKNVAQGCMRAPWGVSTFMPLGNAATVTAKAVPAQEEPKAAAGGA